jgi:hypothetical protein
VRRLELSATSAPLPSSRQVPDLAGEARRPGSALAQQATRRPQAAAPLTAGFRGDRMPGARRTARPLLQARSPGVRNGEDRRAAGAGERRGGSGPRRCAAALRALHVDPRAGPAFTGTYPGDPGAMPPPPGR